MIRLKDKTNKMKKILPIISVLLLMNVFLCNAQSISNIYRRFCNQENVEKVNLSPVTMFFLRPFINNSHVNGLSIKSIQILDLSSCDCDVKQYFSDLVMNIDDCDYETIVRVNDGDEKARILARVIGESIREIVILKTGDDAAFVRLRGRFSMNEVEQLADRN